MVTSVHSPSGLLLSGARKPLPVRVSPFSGSKNQARSSSLRVTRASARVPLTLQKSPVLPSVVPLAIIWHSKPRIQPKVWVVPGSPKEL